MTHGQSIPLESEDILTATTPPQFSEPGNLGPSETADGPAAQFREVEVGGDVIEVPADAPPEVIEKIVQTHLASPEFDKLIDKGSGAPVRVRTLVGSAPLKDRLANLKRFYPDAIPFGEDNFVFTDPDTARPTLYNPEGLDVGDIASVAREGAQAVGATLGATFGAAGGFVVGTPAGPGAFLTGGAGAAAGAGLGSAAGGSLFDISANLFLGRIDTRSLPERIIETGLDVLGGAVGQRAGELVGVGAKAAIGGGKQAAQRLVEAFRRLTVTPPAGAASGSRAVGTVEKMLETTPSSSAIMQRNAEKILEQTKAAAETLAARFGTVKTPLGAGETIKAAAVRAAERFGFKQEKVYQEAFELVGADTAVGANSVRALRETMMEELGRAPQSLQGTLGRSISMLRAIEADAAEGIPFSALRQIRTNVGRDIAAPQLSGSSGAQNEALKRIYGALTEDMSAAARQAGPAAAKKLAVADRFTRIYMNTAAKTMEKINRFDADERAYNFVISATKDGVQMLSRLKRHFTPEEWDTVAATVLGRMGLARPGAQNVAGDAFSVNTFLTNWNRISPEAKKLLFGGERYKDLAPVLDDLVRVVGSLKQMEKLTNTSNTGRNMIAWMTMQTLVGGAGGAALGGDPQSVGVGILATIIAPRLAARLITSPRFVRWLTTPITKPSGLSAHLGRLVGIAVAEPELREAIDQYVAALRSAPSPRIEPKRSQEGAALEVEAPDLGAARG